MLRIYFFYLGAVLLVVCLFFTAPPASFPTSSIVTIEEGTGLYKLAEKLQSDRVIRSPFLFRVIAVVLGGERDMKAGQYFMPSSQNVLVVAWRVFHGDYNVETVRVTIPEGFNVKKIASLFDERFQMFDHESFISTAPEGYLFPDTYFIPVTATASSTIKLLGDNFNRQISASLPSVQASQRTLAEVITMASIIEGEANTQVDREIISGILWKRIKLGMPLQVDASFVYVNGKTTKELTVSDLKIDSPYNTYLYRGLPPTPISNPGLESIAAALNPTTTPYLYFLTGDDGTMHYSSTFKEHVEKKNTYIENQ